MRIITLLGMALLMSACQPQAVNQTAQQQHFICKSLIDGFLKTQSLGEYQLHHLEPTLQHSSLNRTYTYRSSSENGMKMYIPKQPNLYFKCQQASAQHFNVQLIDPKQHTVQNLLSLELPAQKTIDTLTAFSLKTQ